MMDCQTYDLINHDWFNKIIKIFFIHTCHFLLMTVVLLSQPDRTCLCARWSHSQTNTDGSFNNLFYNNQLKPEKLLHIHHINLIIFSFIHSELKLTHTCSSATWFQCTHNQYISDLCVDNMLQGNLSYKPWCNHLLPKPSLLLPSVHLI